MEMIRGIAAYIFFEAVNVLLLLNPLLHGDLGTEPVLKSIEVTFLVVSAFVVSYAEVSALYRFRLRNNHDVFVLRHTSWLKLLFIGLYYFILIYWNLHFEQAVSGYCFFYFIAACCAGQESPILAKINNQIYYVDGYGTQSLVENVMITKEDTKKRLVIKTLDNQQRRDGTALVKGKLYSREWVQKLSEFTGMTV